MPLMMRRCGAFGRPVRGSSGGRCGSRRRHCASLKSPRLTRPQWEIRPETSAVCRSPLEALRQKARRVELFSTVAVGFVKAGRSKIEPDPDLHVREAIGLVFARFAEMQSIRQVFLSLRADRIALPYIDHRQAGERRPLWKLPVYATVNNLLTNPVYAGAYAFGRTG